MIRLIIFLFILFCFGCCSSIVSPVNHIATNNQIKTIYINVYLDKDFNATERFEISEALGISNNFFNGYFVYRMAQDDFNVEENEGKITDNDLLFIQAYCDNSGLLGWSHGIPSNKISLCTNNLQIVGDPVEVVAHEILHSRGAIHSSHKGSLMYSSFVSQASNGWCVDQYSLPGILNQSPWIKKQNLNYCAIP